MSASKAGRTVAEILADPSTPRLVVSLMEDVLMAWERIDREQKRLGEWAMEGRAIETEGRDV
jgi:homoserine acetyltransferase